MLSSAAFSADGRHRYRLDRRWGPGPVLAFVMLNPSTADGTRNDHTIRLCINRAQRTGYGALAVANLFSWRATDPRELRRASDPVGPENDQWLLSVCKSAQLIVAAWGAPGGYLSRDTYCTRLICHAGFDLYVLGTTKHGRPRHPLRMAGNIEPRLWRAGAALPHRPDRRSAPRAPV